MATFQLPYDFTIGAGAYWESAFRWTPTTTFTGDPNVPLPYGVIFTEPRGNREANSNYYRSTCRSPRGSRSDPVRLSAIGSVLNLFSSEAVTGVCAYTTGCGTAKQGDALSWQQPRRYELGFRAEF